MNKKKFEGILICTDIDHTLVNDNGEISKQNAEAIKYFQDNGGLFTVSTGRVYTHLDNFSDSFKVNTYVIQLNGTSIFDTVSKKSVFNIPISKVHLSKISHTIYEKFGKHISTARVGNEHKFFDFSGDVSVCSDDIYKAVFVADTEENAVKIENYIIKEFSDLCAVNRSWNVGFEIINKDSGKGTCVKLLKKLLGDKAKITVCIGDYENDISMLEDCDIGYAVSNALDSVKAAADRITVSNNDSAIAAVIKDIEKAL